MPVPQQLGPESRLEPELVLEQALRHQTSRPLRARGRVLELGLLESLGLRQALQPAELLQLPVLGLGLGSQLAR